MPTLTFHGSLAARVIKSSNALSLRRPMLIALRYQDQLSTDPRPAIRTWSRTATSKGHRSQMRSVREARANPLILNTNCRKLDLLGMAFRATELVQPRTKLPMFTRNARTSLTAMIRPGKLRALQSLSTSQRERRALLIKMIRLETFCSTNSKSFRDGWHQTILTHDRN